MKRMAREAATVEVMIHHYCRTEHGSQDGGLCGDCEKLLGYARKRLAHCPFQEGKTTCGKCQVHCYKPEMREKIRQVMRTIGPRLLLTNPIMALQHALDGLRKHPVKPLA
ncbi:nitrous oxide-stimulated promoter family protein [Candidatus Electronema sp. PJ]|uniref:nitrous oxide-stimulated promoter family protein n=1 Tax=Candidatus Electronema sp. PJ TaxID=3401572 RepID=UPI003AA95DB8